MTTFDIATCIACNGKTHTPDLNDCPACDAMGLIGCGCGSCSAGVVLALVEVLDSRGYGMEIDEVRCPAARAVTPAEKAAHERDAIGWTEPAEHRAA